MARLALAPDLTLATVARLLGHESARAFGEHLPAYQARGFPAPDPLTGRIDPEAFERWRRLRASHLFPELTAPVTARDPRQVWAERRAGKWRGAAG